MLLRVSAYSWLQGAHDAAFNTGHRYEPPTLLAALKAADFKIARVTYANTLLASPAIALRLLQRWHILALSDSTYTSPWINCLLTMALRLESRWLQKRNLPLGLSLWVLARK